MKYEITFKNGQIKNVVSKDVNKVKNYITESFNKISSVKRLDESKNRIGYPVEVISNETEKINYDKVVNSAYKKANKDAKELRKINNEEGRDKEIAKIAMHLPKTTSIKDSIFNMMYIFQLIMASDLTPDNIDRTHKALGKIYDNIVSVIVEKYNINPISLIFYDSLEDFKKSNKKNNKILNMTPQEFLNINYINKVFDIIGDEIGW